MKITISGTLGSGKSTIAKMLAEKLNYEHYSTGKFMRTLAEENNMSLLELTKISDENTSFDKKTDDYQIKLGKNKDNFVLEGRLGFYFIPDSIKIYLKCDEKTAAQRVLKDFKEKNIQRIKEGLRLNTGAKKEGINKIEQNILEDLKTRRDSESKRYFNLYKVNQDDESNFDLVIDTTNITPDKICNKIIASIQNNKKNSKTLVR
jgi:CMP/dCMP kinase